MNTNKNGGEVRTTDGQDEHGFIRVRWRYWRAKKTACHSWQFVRLVAVKNRAPDMLQIHSLALRACIANDLNLLKLELLEQRQVSVVNLERTDGHRGGVDAASFFTPFEFVG